MSPGPAWLHWRFPAWLLLTDFFPLHPQPSPCCCHTSPGEALACTTCLSRGQQCPQGSPRPQETAPTQELQPLGRVSGVFWIFCDPWGDPSSCLQGGSCSFLAVKRSRAQCSQPDHPWLSSGHYCSLGILSDLCHFWKEWIAGHCRVYLQVDFTHSFLISKVICRQNSC